MGPMAELATIETEQTAFTEYIQSPNLAAPERIISLSEVDINRLLTEVDHLSWSLKQFGYVPDTIKKDVVTNLGTALAEVSMPFAVTRTEHEIETIKDPETNQIFRTFKWLGRSAIGVAESGYDFHISEAAKRRVDIEVEEAIHAEETLKPGRMQFFISPRMTEADAPVYVAKKEHLHSDDSIRASYLAVDKEGNQTHRVMESLLVRDVPLEAWVAMLSDENNIFGKSIEVSDETSAIGVMGTFAELDIPLENVPEGPVTLVAEVVSYIEDKKLQLSVQQQLDEYRNNQQLYRDQAAESAENWYDFEMEVATSLLDGSTTPKLTEFIANVESLWPEAERSIVRKHPQQEGYVMSRALAAVVEKTKRNTIATRAGIAVGNKDIIEQVDSRTISALHTSANRIDDPNTITRSDDLDRSIIQQNVNIGGGCSGSACGLESVASGSKEDAFLRKELGADTRDTITKDKVRACECGEKEIVYAHNSTKVTKMCQSCGRKETKYTTRKTS